MTSSTDSRRSRPTSSVADDHRMAAELHDRHLHRVAGAGRGLLEQQGRAPAGEHAPRLGIGGQVQDPGQLVAGQVVDLEQVAGTLTSASRLQHAARRMATPSSISAAETVNGGVRRSDVGVTALTTRPAARASACTARASSPGPARRRAAGPGPARRPRRAGRRAPRWSVSPALAAARRQVVALHDRQHGPGRRGRQGLAAEGRGVVAGLEGGGDVAPGPAGADGHAVAQRLGHGDDVGHAHRSARWPNHRPVRPSPVCTSSTMSSSRRSSQSRRTSAR